jgi:hypothetical protein
MNAIPDSGSPVREVAKTCGARVFYLGPYFGENGLLFYDPRESGFICLRMLEHLLSAGTYSSGDSSQFPLFYISMC